MAEWLAAMGTPASPDRVVLTTGAQHALLIALAATTRPGDTVLAEELTYSGMKDLSIHMHLKLRGVALDGEGLRRTRSRPPAAYPGPACSIACRDSTTRRPP